MPTAAQARVIRSTQTSPNASDVRDITTAFGTTADNTTSHQAPATDAGGFRFIPNATTGTSTTPPSTGTAQSNQGWRDTVAQNASVQISYAAGTWTLRGLFQKKSMFINATVTWRFTAIVYRVSSGGTFGQEIGRVAFADTDFPTVGANIALTGSFTTGAATVFTAGDKVHVEVYGQHIVAGIPAAVVNSASMAIVLDATNANNGTAFTAQPTFTVQNVQAHTATAVGTAAMARRITAFKVLVATAVGTVAMARRITAFRTFTATAVGTTPAVVKMVGVVRATTAVGTAAMARRITAFRTFTATATGTAAMARTITAFRVFTATAVGTAVYARALILGRMFAATAVGTAAMARRITAFRTFTATGVGTATRILRVGVVRATTAVGTGAMARTITAFRTFSASGVGTAAVSRRVSITKTATATGTAAMARTITAFRTFAATAVGTAVVARRVGVVKTATAVGTAVMARSLNAARSFATSAVGVATYARALIFGRTFTTTGTVTPRLRLDIPEEALDRIIPAAAQDWPLNAPTKTIAGVTRNSAGAVVVSATVKLIRQSDDVTVATLTSHATTGAYSFTRGGDDPYSYRVLATKAGAPEIHGVTDVLVPA